MNVSGGTPPSQGGSPMPWMVGLLVGGMVGMVLAGGGGYVLAKRQANKMRQGWNLVPVVVAAVDLAEDTVVTFDMISQRSVPEQFVTGSVVKPDSASYIVNQKILVPVLAGDPLLWSQFETKKQPVVLIAAQDIPTGVVLDTQDLIERRMPQELVTPSYVPKEDQPKVVGRTVSAPFRKGDPILWTHLQTEPAPVAPKRR
ncbi:MAG: hypothetical protein K1X89_08285 [Myxococcaceae bacterium]|nr:hypothetical protein [Myxococcaceae bacterium]